jgi:hypothetical protein
MSSARLLFSACYRDIPVYPEIVLRDLESSGGFLETGAPLPVGTVLMLTPSDNADLRVPARVISVVEACRTEDNNGAPPGMKVVFEAQAAQLLADVDSDAPTTTKDAPAEDLAPADEVEPAEPPDDLEVAAAAVEPQSAEEPQSVAEPQSLAESQSAAESQSVAESQSAEEPLGDVVEMEADYDAPDEEASGQPQPGETAAGDGEDKKKKKKSRGGRRKKR